jgi:hypothetical protein
MVALGMVLWYPYVLVHVEGDDVPEGELAVAVEVHEVSIHAQRRRTGRQAEDKGMGRGRLRLGDTVGDVLSSPKRKTFVIRLNDEPHGEIKFRSE